MWSYARRYLGLSYHPAFEETVSADQGHGGGVACTAEVDIFEGWRRRSTHNVDGTVEIQDVLGNLKLITNHKKHMERRVVMTHSLRYLLLWQRIHFLWNTA